MVETAPDTVPALTSEAARRVPPVAEAKTTVGAVRVGLEGLSRGPVVPDVVAAMAAVAGLRRGVAIAHAPTAVPETPVPSASQVAPILKVAALADLRVMGPAEAATGGAADAIGAAPTGVPLRRPLVARPTLAPTGPVASLRVTVGGPCA